MDIERMMACQGRSGARATRQKGSTASAPVDPLFGIWSKSLQHVRSVNQAMWEQHAKMMQLSTHVCSEK